jgi:hypothetical protein
VLPAPTSPLPSHGLTASTIRVKELIERVYEGKIRVPAFQRPLRWRSQDVLALLDSVWRGYPVGSLLFWRRSAPAGTIRIGGHHHPVPELHDAWWLVDGQQRTTALAAALLPLDHSGDNRWIASFDPRVPEFRGGPPGKPEVDISVPVATLGDLRRLGRWIRESAVDDHLLGIIEDAQQRLLDYSIPIYIVETEHERVLREVFARLNSTGARMRADEIFQALHGGQTAGQGPSLDLDQLAASCDLDGFGRPARADILKAILAIAGHDPYLTITSNIDAIEGLPAASEVEEALAHAREFLQEHCHIPWLGLVPYPVAFILLARWFYLFPETDEGARASLRGWLWRSALSGAHERANVSKMRHQVRELVAGDLEGSLRRLLAPVSDLREAPWSLEPFNSVSARSRIEILSLLSQKPCDENGPVVVQELLAGDNGRIAREIFATPDTGELDEHTQRLAKTAANRVILGGAHTGLKTTLREWSGRPELLATHLIDEESARALHRGDAASFLRLRAPKVRAAVDAFLHRSAGFDDPILRPVSIYFDPDPDLDPDPAEDAP